MSGTGDDSLSAGINGNQNDNSSSAVGAVYVFVKNANSWVQRSYVKSTDPTVNSIFGRSVAINTAGTILVVGERTDISGSFPGDHGSVYIY